jgi:hypothetical protein
MIRSTKSFFGIIWDNIKAGFTFVMNGFTTSRAGTEGITRTEL